MKVKVLSLTDHDTMMGVEAALSAGLELGIGVIPGVEISATLSLGYGTFLLGFMRPMRIEITQNNVKSVQILLQIEDAFSTHVRLLFRDYYWIFSFS